MSFLKNSECYVITWDKTNSVYGIHVSKKKNRCFIQRAVFKEGNENINLKDRLKKAYEELAPPKNALFVIGGYIPKTVFFEIKMPVLEKKELYDAIELEIPRHVPYSIEELRWSYSIDEKKDNTLFIKVCVIVEDTLEGIFSLLNEIEIKVDAFIYPFMIPSALLSQEYLYLKGIDPNFVYLKKEMIPTPTLNKQYYKDFLDFFDGKEEIRKVKGRFYEDEIHENFIPSLLLASYTFHDNFIKDKLTMLKLPSQLVPVRNKFMKFTFSLSILVVLILTSSYIYRVVENRYSRYSALSNEIIKVRKKIQKIKNVNKLETIKSSKYSNIKLLKEAKYGTTKIIHCLYYISKNIPDNVWVKSLGSNNKTIKIELLSNSNIPGNILTNLNNFEIKKKSTGMNGGIYRAIIELEYMGENNE